jgi:hypothetical protein
VTRDNHLLALSLLVAAIGMPGVVACAAEWSLTPSGQLLGAIQSNPGLQAQNVPTARSLAAKFVVDLQRRTERSSVIISPQLLLQRYRHNGDLNRDEQRIDLTLRRQGEYLSWTGFGTAARDTTLTSELGTTGLTQSARRHQVVELTAGPRWQLSERLSTRSAVLWRSHRYPGKVQSGLTDYAYRSGTLGVDYELNERTGISLSGVAGRLTSGGAQQPSDDFSINLETQFRWRPQWSGGVVIGPSQARSGGASRDGLAFHVEVTRTTETVSLSASLGRAVSQAGRGVLTERDDLSLSGTRRLSERSEVALSAGGTVSRDALPRAGLVAGDVRYGHAEVNLRRRLNDNWNVNLLLGYTMQRIGTSSAALARGVEAQLGFEWSGNGRRH